MINHMNILEKSSTLQKDTQKGFSLVELAVAITIIGFIIAGVLTGQYMRKAATLRAQVTQVQQYQAAFASFYDKYRYAPGDLPKATTYWPSAASVLNGNGNGMINDTEASGTHGAASDEGGGTARFDGEKLQFFRHLSLSGFIKEQYDGSQTLGAGYPRLAYGEAYGFYAATYWRPNSVFGMTNQITEVTKVGPYVYLALMAGDPSYINSMWAMASYSIFIPSDLQDIDTKLDDGIYNKGKFFGFASCCAASSYNCITGSNYNPTSSNRECIAMYRLK